MLRRRSLWILWAVLPLLGGGIAFAQSFQSLSQAGDAALAAGHTNEAEHDYRAALALRPGWTEGWWNLGAAQYQANQYSDAAASLRKLTELAPKAAAGWSLLGLSEFETGHYSDALASLERAQSLGGIGDPDIQRVSSYHLALLLIHNGEFERAATLLRGTFGSAPPQQAKTALGLALLRVPLLPKNVDPSKDAQIAAAGEAAASSNAVQALADFAAQYPQTPWAHYAYGLALAKAGEQEQAAAQFRLEAAISPRSPLPHRALAKALAAMGQTRQAAVEQHEAERLAQDTTGRSPRMIALYAARGASEAQEGAAGWSDAMRDYSAGEYAKAVAALKIWVSRTRATEPHGR